MTQGRTRPLHRPQIEADRPHRPGDCPVRLARDRPAARRPGRGRGADGRPGRLRRAGAPGAGDGRARPPAARVRGRGRADLREPRPLDPARPGAGRRDLRPHPRHPQRRAGQARRAGAAAGVAARSAAAGRAGQSPRCGRQGSGGTAGARLRRRGGDRLPRPLPARPGGGSYRRARSVVRSRSGPAPTRPSRSTSSWRRCARSSFTRRSRSASTRSRRPSRGSSCGPAWWSTSATRARPAPLQDAGADGQSRAAGRAAAHATGSRRLARQQ